MPIAQLKTSMDSPTVPPPSAPPKKLSKPVALLVGICGLIVIVGGILQVTKGIKEMRGAGPSDELNRLMQEVEQAVAVANRTGLEAGPLFQKLLNDVDGVGLAKVRKDQKEGAQKIAGLFATSAEQFHLAAKKSEAAAQMESREKFKPFFTLKAQAYESYGKARELNQSIVQMVLDESIVQVDDLVKKATAAGQERDAAETSAKETEAKAEAVAKEAKAHP